MITWVFEELTRLACGFFGVSGGLSVTVMFGFVVWLGLDDAGRDPDAFSAADGLVSASTPTFFASGGDVLLACFFCAG